MQLGAGAAWQLVTSKLCGMTVTALLVFEFLRGWTCRSITVVATAGTCAGPCGLVSSELPARACQCGFCRKHDSLYTSDPQGQMRFTVQDRAAIIRYRFASKTADFLICRRCGVYVGAQMKRGGPVTTRSSTSIRSTVAATSCTSQNRWTMRAKTQLRAVPGGRADGRRLRLPPESHYSWARRTFNDYLNVGPSLTMKLAVAVLSARGTS